MMRFGGGLARGMIGGPGIIGCVIGFIFFVAIVVVVIALIVHYSKGSRQHLHSSESNTGNNALAILNERLAKGEITVEEYNNIKLHIQK